MLLIVVFCSLLAPVVDIESILDASHYLHYGVSNGNAVAVTSTKALCALHNSCPVDKLVRLVDSHGHSRVAVVTFAKYEENLVDIALLELQFDQPPFNTFVPIATAPVSYLQKLYIIGRTTDISSRETIPVTAECQVNVIHAEGALFRSTYTGYDGLSGAGVVVVERINNDFLLAGVHIGTQDHTVPPPAIKKRKGNVADAESASASSESLARSIHGHTAYCLVCEVQRVPDLVQLLL